MIYSSTRSRLERKGVDPTYFVQRQALAIGLGVIAMVLCIAVDYRQPPRPVGCSCYLAVLPLLVGVLVVGASRKGAQAWFNVGPLQFQPSEVAKLAVIIAVAGYCHQHRGDLDAWRLAVAVLIAAVPIGLVLMQNDLGSAAVIGVCAGAILLVAGIRARHAVVLLLLAITAVGAVVSLGHARHLQDRPHLELPRPVDRHAAHPSRRRREYNLEQAKSAIVTGGFRGSGLFNGTLTKNAYVPEQHTDFIFTVVGEELGFVGGALVIALYGLLIWRLWRIARVVVRLLRDPRDRRRARDVRVPGVREHRDDARHHADHRAAAAVHVVRRLGRDRAASPRSGSALNVHMRRFS